MDQALDPMTSGLLRNRKEVTERHREEGDKKMEERLEGRSHKLRTPRLAGSPQKLGQRPGRASHSDEIRCVLGWVCGGGGRRQLLTQSCQKGPTLSTLDLRLLATRL